MNQQALAAMVMAAATTAIMLQATRVFVSYMVFVIDQSERVQLGVTAGAVFLAIGLGALIPRFVPIPRAVVILAMGMVATRLVLQFWSIPEARMWLGAATVLLAGWLFPFLLWQWRAATATGVGIGFVLDLAFRIGRVSIDLPLIPTIGAHLTTIILAGTALYAALALRAGVSSRPASGLAVGGLALGPALTLQHLLIGNLGAVQLRADTGMAAGAWLLAIGMVAGLTIDVFFARRPGSIVTGSASERGLVPILIIAGGLGLLVGWQDTAGLGAFGMVAGTAATLALIMAALRGASGASTFTATALWVTGGLLVQAALLFAYFTATGLPALIALAFVIVAGCGLVAAWRPARERVPSRMAISGLGMGTLIVAGALLLLTLRTSDPEPGAPLPVEFTTLTYNIQSGFSRENFWDLEATARIIEASGADIVVLQEVGRGWPILTGSDQARWLSHRLDMQLVWGPASRDGLWGNAILTNAPIISTDTIRFDVTENLRRGAVLAVVESDADPVTVVGTHLDNPGDAESARQAQIAQLLDFWNGVRPAIIAGDFNTDPDSAAMTTFADAGFIDTGSGLGVDATTSQDDRRIDYVVVTPGLDIVEAEILDTWVSDHRPFLVRLAVMS